ncbi:PAS domain-containing sensor histidine kinase, partial [bacterium]|nr:PAS domain-containing sensor histidine kinase [bacterium]
MILSAIPLRTVDLLGSALMILFSFLCLGLVRELRRRDRNNVIWIYLLLVCIGFASFALSRSAGHILRQILTISGHSSIWASIGPFSGAINTFTFI